VSECDCDASIMNGPLGGCCAMRGGGTKLCSNVKKQQKQQYCSESGLHKNYVHRIVNNVLRRMNYFDI